MAEIHDARSDKCEDGDGIIQQPANDSRKQNRHPPGRRFCRLLSLLLPLFTHCQPPYESQSCPKAKRSPTTMKPPKRNMSNRSMERPAASTTPAAPAPAIPSTSPQPSSIGEMMQLA